MHEVLVNRLGGLSLPRKSVVRLTDRPDMTLDVYRGRKTTMQQPQAQEGLEYYWGGRQGLESCGSGKGGQIPSRHMTSSRRRMRRRYVPTRFLINQCPINTFLILKSDIENSRIEMRGIVLPVPSNQI